MSFVQHTYVCSPGRHSGQSGIRRPIYAFRIKYKTKYVMFKASTLSKSTGQRLDLEASMVPECQAVQDLFHSNMQPKVMI